jgi:hypothetical protein
MTTKKKSTKKTPRDLNQNAKRIFDEMIERSEEAPKRGNIKAVPSPQGTRRKLVSPPSVACRPSSAL